MVKLVAVSSAVVVACNLVLLATLANWVQSAPPQLANWAQSAPPQIAFQNGNYGMFGAAYAPQSFNSGATGRLQRRCCCCSQLGRFKRQLAAPISPVVPALGNEPNRKKIKKNDKPIDKPIDKPKDKPTKSKRLLADCLAAHNKYRRQHGVPDLVWSDKVSEAFV